MGSMVELMLSVLEAWGSIPSTRKRQRGQRGKEGRRSAIVSSQFNASTTDEETDQRSQAPCSDTRTLVHHELKSGPQLWLLALDSFSDSKARSCLPSAWLVALLRSSLPMSPQDQAAKNKALQSMAAMSSAQIVSATAFHSKMALARGPGYPAISGVSGAAQSKRPTQLPYTVSSAELGTVASLDPSLLSPPRAHSKPLLV